jgi:hypothetical protein
MTQDIPSLPLVVKLTGITVWLCTWKLNPRVINRVEEMAKKNITFRKLLSRAYQNSMPPVVYERVKAAALYDDHFNSKI